MSLDLNNLRPAKGSRRPRKRIGRGNSSGHGSYSGKGIKGQRARSGGKGGLKFLGFRDLMTQIPQKRGFKSLSEKMTVVNLQEIERSFAAGETVTPKTLFARGLIRSARFTGIKVLGNGKLTKSLTFRGITFSSSARKAVEERGGKVE